MSLKTGDKAPEFELKSQSGETVRLNDFKGKKAVVLYFYPKDDTTICTKEACSFRDSYDVFKEAGAEVIGVSSDSEGSHQGFAKKYGLPFVLLSDPGAQVRKRYEVSSTLGLLPGRETFVIDKQGIIRHRFSSQLSAQRHVDEALKILKGL